MYLLRSLFGRGSNPLQTPSDQETSRYSSLSSPNQYERRTLNPNPTLYNVKEKANLSLKQREHLSHYFGGDPQHFTSHPHHTSSYRSSPAMATQSTLQYVL